MRPSNSSLPRLGFSTTDRVVIVHADDIGMCHATVAGLDDLFEAGIVSSGATMVPCSWFPAVVNYCQAHPEVDLGVHLTVTSEWSTYRWGPISTRDPRSGMLDDAGYFPRRSGDIQLKGDPRAVSFELEAQLERALAAGIDVTHLDTHMGSLIHPRFLPGYVALAMQRRLPLMLARLTDQERRERGIGEELAALGDQLLRQLTERGWPVFDHLAGLPLDQPSERLEQAKRAFDRLPPGLSLLIIHPAVETPELRAIAPDWPSRVADFHTFTSRELRSYLRNAGIQIIGYRRLRDLVRDPI